MKKLLIFPPYWTISHPYLSLPCLISYLRNKGTEVDVIDLNAKCLNKMFSSEFIECCKIRLESNLKLSNEENSSLETLALCEYVINNIDNAIKTLKNADKFYKIDQQENCKHVLDYAMHIISEAYSPLKISKYDFNINKYNKDITKKIEYYLASEHSDPFKKMYTEFIPTDLLLECDFVGISLIGFEQILPVFSLCKYIKSVNPSIHIMIGGSVFSKLFEDIERNDIFFNYFDSIILFEGEEPLYQLINTLDYGKSLSSVDNLIYYDKKLKKVVFNPISKLKCDINDLPLPDFSDYNFEEYLSPDPIIPYYLSRSCFWSKCSFCDHDAGYDGKFRIRSIDKAVEEIKLLKKNYNARLLHFVDEAITPKILDKLCDKLLQEKVSINWFCYIRGSSKFDYSLCKKMKLAGCVHVMIGVESCSDSVLVDMNKGITVKDIEVTLTNMNYAGIWVHSFLINNFPTETTSDKMKSLIFILERLDLFHSLGMGEFSLLRNAKMLNDPDKYGLKNISSPIELNNTLHYECAIQDLDDKDSSSSINRVLKKLSYTQYTFNNKIFYREHLPMILTRYPHWSLSKNDPFKENKISRKKQKYCLNSLYYKQYNSKVFVINLLTRKTYLLNKYMKDILDLLASPIEHKDFIDILIENGHARGNLNKIWDFLNNHKFLRKVYSNYERDC